MRALLILLPLLTACPKGPIHVGSASWYGPGFKGKPTASGEKFRPRKRTAAHKTLPFGTVLRVRNTDNGKRVRVVVNDRGPYAGGRILDLSKGAARRVDMLDSGVAQIEFRVVGCKARFDNCQ